MISQGWASIVAGFDGCTSAAEGVEAFTVLLAGLMPIKKTEEEPDRIFT